VWIGVGWITFVIEVLNLDEHGCCIGGGRQYRRVRDPDLAARVWRACAFTGPVKAAITPKARATGKGIEIAVALAQRGIPVSFDALPESASLWDYPFIHEIDWADDRWPDTLPQPGPLP
jgi:hypothetical protein